VIIDGHNDLVVRTWRGKAPNHLDLEVARSVGFSGGFFAIWLPSPSVVEPTEVPYLVPLPEPLSFEEASTLADELYDVLRAMPVRLARSADDFVEGEITAIVHLEGAEPIAPDLSNLDEWHERGLRSIGLVWSRPNAFAAGVPLAFPSSPDTGPGLTDAGRALVGACNERGILVDVSHLTEQGFWDVASLSSAPLVATHSGAHALCTASRNLTDAQLDAIAASNGIVGACFAVNFLRADGSLVSEKSGIVEIVRHIDYMVERMGIDHVAFGSDFEGADMPVDLGGVAGFPALLDALRSAGYDDAALAKLTHENWLRIFRTTWR
jgi:membrane dipeptidase